MQPKKRWGGSRFSLDVSFETVDDLLFGLIVRVRELVAENGEHIIEAVNAVARRSGYRSYQDILPSGLESGEFLIELAEVLRLPAALLACRIEEAREHERLVAIQAQICDLGEISSSNDPGT